MEYDIDRYLAYLFEKCEQGESENEGVLSDSVRCEWFLPNQEERARIIESIEVIFDNLKMVLKSKIKASVLPEIEVLKGEVMDIWRIDRLNFKEYYLKGKLIEVKGLNYGNIIARFCTDIALIDFENAIRKRIEEIGLEVDFVEGSGTLKWVASPAALGFIMGELVQKGYIEPPRKRDGEVHYTDFAELLGGVFSDEIGSKQNLRQLLSPDNEKGLSEANKKRFNIPDVKEIS